MSSVLRYVLSYDFSISLHLFYISTPLTVIALKFLNTNSSLLNGSLKLLKWLQLNQLQLISILLFHISICYFIIAYRSIDRFLKLLKFFFVKRVQSTEINGHLKFLQSGTCVLFSV